MSRDSTLNTINWHRHWLLESGTDFLNHGSFGASPKRVLKRQSELRRRMEQQPVRFFDRELLPLWDEARGELARFVGADSEGLAFVPNATTGVNTVLRSMAFDPGDELLVTDHTYDACRCAVRYVAERTHADIVVAEIPFPIDNQQTVVERILEAVTPRTELALVDHVTSPTGLILPVDTIVDRLHARDVDVLVDGAHAPGMLDLDLESIGAEFYTGNCHKWLCAPKGAAFLHVDEHHRDVIHPLSISDGYCQTSETRSSFHLEFDWTGTDDPTPFLCIPEAIACLDSLLPEGWDDLREHNHALALKARDIVCEALEVTPPAPAQMLGSMAALPLSERRLPSAPDELERTLAFDHGFEVPIKTPPEPLGPLIRVSAQLYNTPEQYEHLAAVLVDEVLD